MHTTLRLFALALPVVVAACGPAPMDPGARLSHRAPEIASAAPVAPSAPPVEAAPPRAPWVGVAAARGAPGVLAAWTSSRVAVSRDDGKHYHWVLDGKGDVVAATLDDAGTLFAVRGTTTLGVVARGGEVTWRAIPFAKRTTALVAGGGVLAWIGERDVATPEGARLAISRDEGASWKVVDDAPELGDFANGLAIDPDGTLRLVTSTESDCGGGWQARWTGDLATGAWREAAWPLDAPGAWGIGDEGWTYAIGDCGDGGQGKLCAIDPTGRASTIAVTRAATFTTLHAVTNGHATWAAIDGRLAWLSRGAVMFPAAATPRGFDVAAVDADDQPIGIADGRAVRWTRDGRWRSLFGH